MRSSGGLNKVGMVLQSGLNPVAAAVEAGIEVVNHAMSGMIDYGKLSSFWDLIRSPRKGRLTLFRVFIIGDATEQIRSLSSGLIQQGFTCSVIANHNNDEDAIEQVTEQAPELVTVDMPRAFQSALRIGDLVDRIKDRGITLPLLLFSPERRLAVLILPLMWMISSSSPGMRPKWR